MGQASWAASAALALMIGCGDDDVATAPKRQAGAAAQSGTSAGAGGNAGGRADGGRSGGAAGRAGQAGGGSGKAGAGGNAGGSAGSAGAADGGGAAPKIADCDVFPVDDVWNRVIEGAAVSSTWTTHLQNLAGKVLLHPDYGNDGADHYGIPINVVPSSQTKVSVSFDDYPDESDPGPYPFPDPAQAKIEGGTPEACDGDCHFIAVQQGECKLYEGYSCHWTDGAWHCSNGAIWDLKRDSVGQRPEGWTSADAAGLAIAPGLIRYDEANAGEIDHAIRFTLHCSRNNYVDPATHAAVPGGCSSVAADAPPMGLRVRLKSSYDISNLSGSAHAVARAMQRYGMILADNGSDFYFQGEEDPRWTDADISPLKAIPASAFEALEPGELKSPPP
jgi:hypothetical protein